MSKNIAATNPTQILASGNNVYVSWLQNGGGEFFTKSSDNGNTFSTPVNLNTQTYNSYSRMAVSGNNLYFAWSGGSSPNPQILLMKSTDNGNTFGNVINLSNVSVQASGVQIDVSENNLYVGWMEILSSQNYDIFFSTVTPSLPDTIPPVVTPPQNMVIQLNSTSVIPTPVAYHATATDNVGVTSGPTCTPASGSTFPVGTTTVTCTASDAAGNVGKATFSVTVNAQQISGVPITVTADKSSYNFGDTITISGTVNQQLNIPISIVIKDPSQHVVYITQTNPNSDNTYSTQATTNGTLFNTSGTYEIDVTYGGVDKTSKTTFQFSTSSSITSQQQIQTTSGGTLQVGFSTDPINPDTSSQTQLQINFINKNTNQIQPHIDYKISVMQGGNQVYGIPITHTALGAVTIPFQFQTAGTYQIIVDVEGIVFQPITPETATFSISTVGNNIPPSSNNEIDMVLGAGASASATCVAANNCFSPDPLYVSPGTTVTWTNTDTVSHTVTSGKVSDNNAGSLFDSGLVKPGKTFQFTFANTGTYDYVCTVHPWMVGQVIVGNGVQPLPTSSSTITAETDKSSYTAGDSIVVSGTVNPVNSVNPQQPVTIQTYDLYNILVRIDQAIPSPSGQFSATIPAHGPAWQNSGTYTLKIQYDQPSSASKLTFYFNSGTVTPTPQSQAEIDISTGSGASASATCVAANNCFTPNPLYVSPGTTVTWKNTDILSHTVTSGHASDNDAGSLYDSGLIKTGNTFQFTFATAGTYNYFCTVHPWMVGQVVVGQGGQPTESITLPPILKIVAKEWSQNTISDFDFLQSVQYLINQGMLVVPHNTLGNRSSETAIPQWIKNNATLWANGSVSDATFASGIEYLFNAYYLPVSVSGIPTPISNAQNPSIPTPTDIKVGTDRTLYYGGDTVTASIVLSGANAGQNIAISFNDPTGSTIISRTVTTDNTGMATSQFKIPITAKAGTYQVVVTSSVNSKEFNASSQFTIQQRIDQVSIISVQATDQQGNPVSSFSRGSTGYVKVVLSAQTSIPSLATVNLFDSEYTTLGIGSFKTTLAIGQSTVILSFPIPNDAIVGTGNIYTDVFTDWPSNGGKPLTGESTATVEMK